MGQSRGPRGIEMAASSKFPADRYDDPGDYIRAYAEVTAAGWRSIDTAAVKRAVEVLKQAYTEGRQVFACGNGGSAAIANHLQCDHLKGVHTHTDLSPIVHSLVANTALLTAVANDIAYEEVFAFPLRQLSRPGDVLLSISSSGNSPNILKALECANARDMATVALTGFDGGAERHMAQISIHVDVGNYGVVEDIHQGIMHVLAQYIRQSRIEPGRIAALRF